MTGVSIRAMASALPGENGIKGSVLTGRDILSVQIKETKGFFRYFIPSKNFVRLGKFIDRLENKTGIKTRNILNNASVKYPNTYLGVKAGLRTLEKAGVKPHQVEGLFYGTGTTDFVFPAQGIIIAKLLDIKPRQFGNSSMACTSIADALRQTAEWIDRGLANNALILLGDVTSRLRLPHGNLERYIFGDGFVGIFVEKGKGGFTFTNLKVDTEIADVFVHNAIYSSQIGSRNVDLLDNFQYNDAGLDVMGEVDAVEFPYALEDYTVNSGQKIDQDVKIVTPQTGKNVIHNGIKIFKQDTQIDISPNIVEASSFRHGNIGAGAAPLAMLEGDIKPSDSVLFSLAGVGGVSTIFKIDPFLEKGISVQPLSIVKARPDYKEMVKKSVEELNKKNRKGKFEFSELTMSDKGENISFQPIQARPKQLTSLERVIRSVSNDAAL